MVEHLDGCSACRRLAAALAGVEGERPDPQEPRGRLVSRYVLLECLGAGGMGLVYSAFDPQLERKVALKLIRPDAVRSPEVRARLVAEAKAMARVSHPNVVTVYDAGIHEGQPFVTMQLVVGGSLREHLRGLSLRAWRERLRLLVEAGEGLAAAHAAGIVHRDFKPENVLVTPEGEVRVGDFGLAGELWREELEGPARSEQTRAQAVGTPAYMAPELLAGACADARSDQFSYCLTLFEALIGQRPGVDPRSLEGPTGAGRSLKRLPSRLRRAVLRGLAPKPEDRFPSMRELLAALRLAQPLGRRARLLLVAGGVAAAFAGAGLTRVALVPRPCEQVASRVTTLWNPARRDAVAAAFSRTGLPYERSAAERALSRMDEYAERWERQRIEACEATWVRGERSERALDLEMRCLDRALRDFEALVEVLSKADATVVENAVEAVGGLDDLSDCGDLSRLEREGPTARQDAGPEVLKAATHLSQAKAWYDAGRFHDALLEAGSARALAEASGHRPTFAEARFAEGDARAKTGDYSRAEQELKESLLLAEGLGMDDVAGRASARLAEVVGGNLQRTEAAFDHLAIARAKAERLGDARAAGGLEYVRAMLLHRQGRFDEVLQACAKALPTTEQAYGPEHIKVARIHRLLASTLVQEGRLAAALVHHRRAIELFRSLLGEGHPDGALGLSSAGHLHAALGRHAEALAFHERSLVMALASVGPEHPYVANALAGRAMAREMTGDLEAARADAERALAIRKAVYGPAHPLTAVSLTVLAAIEQRAGRLDLALELSEQADAALQTALRPEHPGRADALAVLGSVLLDSGRVSDARSRLEQALALRAKHPGEPARRARTQFALARALASAGEGARAMELAREALETFSVLGRGFDEDTKRIEAWIAEKR